MRRFALCLLAFAAIAFLAGEALAKDSKQKDVPRQDTSKVKNAHVGGDAQLGSGRKIGGDKGGVSNQNAISGPPSKPNQPAPGSTRPGGMEVSVDPSARPDPGGLKKGKSLEGLPGQQGLDPRLTERGSNPKGDVKQKGEALLQDPRSGGGKSGVEPGTTRYGSKQSMIGKGVVDDTVKGAEQYKGNVTGTADNTPAGSQQRQLKEDIKFDSAAPDPSSDGKVTKWTADDGTIRVRNEDNGTTTILNKDGSTLTYDNKTGDVIDRTKPSTSMPDSDHAPLPDEIQKQIDADVQKLRGDNTRQPGGRNPNNTDPVPDDNDATGTGTGEADESQPIPDKSRLIVNPSSPDGSAARARPSLDHAEAPSGSDPNETDPAPDEP